MTARNFHELWSKGTPLNDAWIELSHEDFDRRKWRALQRSPTNDFDFPETVELGDWLPPTLEGRQSKLWLIERLEKADLVSRLFDGDLWAVGYRTKPHREDTPSRIPRDLFYLDDPEDLTLLVTNWIKGEIQARDEAFFDIRIVPKPVEVLGLDAGRADHDSPQEVAEATPTRRPGRKNMRVRIKAKARELWQKDGTFRALANRTEQAREVKAQELGEYARNADDMPECKLQSVIRWVGEALNETTDPSA